MGALIDQSGACLLIIRLPFGEKYFRRSFCNVIKGTFPNRGSQAEKHGKLHENCDYFALGNSVSKNSEALAKSCHNTGDCSLASIAYPPHLRKLPGSFTEAMCFST